MSPLVTPIVVPLPRRAEEMYADGVAIDLGCGLQLVQLSAAGSRARHRRRAGSRAEVWSTTANRVRPHAVGFRQIDHLADWAKHLWTGSMPEGHTIHRLARDIGELQGKTLRASSPQGRFTDGAADVDGTVLELAEAYGKHLLLHLSRGDSVHVHLGMQGKWFRSADPSAPPLPQVRLRLASDSVAWDLIAPSKCELIDPAGVAAVLSRLGPDPLRSDVNLEDALQALGGAARPIGAVLLDQTVVAGIGNVFRAEALHAVGVAPRRQAGAMTESELRALWTVLQQMMSRAVEEGRIITVDAPNRLNLPESEARKVYKQDRCRDCGAPIVTDQVGGRTSYHCPVEQPS